MSLSGALPNIRGMYRAKQGSCLVHADYSQLELRVMAAVSGDQVLAERLAGGDVYSADARDWFKLPADMDVKKLKPAARKQAKIIHLAFQYAAGTPAVFKQALEQDQTIKYQAAILLHAEAKRAYCRTVAYWFEEQERVRKAGYSESRILGRRRTYPREPPITEIANYPIQSTASDIANLAMIELYKRLKVEVPQARIVVQLHDAFDVECPRSSVQLVKVIMKACMEQPYWIEGKKYLFPVEIKHGKYWNEV